MFNNRRDYWPKGKFGGSSSINAMVYIRGQKEDYDNWKINNWGERASLLQKT